MRAVGETSLFPTFSNPDDVHHGAVWLEQGGGAALSRRARGARRMGNTCNVAVDKGKGSSGSEPMHEAAMKKGCPPGVFDDLQGLSTA